MAATSPETNISPPQGSGARLPWLVGAILLVVAFVYFVPTLFFAYTEDAYVRSDFVAVAPEISGIVQTVAVVNDQAVEAGTLLAIIDDTPFRLDVDLKRRKVESARAAVAVKQDATAVLAANVESSRAALVLAEQEYNRIRPLVADQALSQEMLDRATDKRQGAIDALEQAQAQARVNTGEVTAAEAQVDIAQADLAIAEYNLSRTRITAPVKGYVTNLSLRPGAFASIGVPLVGIVDDTQWRVVANFKEYVASDLKPGMRAWVWLDSHPWHLFPARITGVGRGIARAQEPDRLLPYVAPTTDWIRLARRLPVQMVLDPRPEGVPLFMGADARVLVFP